jgi:hypothetical protein
MISAQPLDGAGNHASDERSTDSREREREKVSLDIYYMNHMLILFILTIFIANMIGIVVPKIRKCDVRSQESASFTS